MQADQTDFRNTLQTLTFGPIQAEGFEDEAYTFCKLLVNYQRMTPWFRTIFHDVMWARRGSTPQITKKGQFYHDMLFRRSMVFGPPLGNPGTFDLGNLINFPWSLTDPQFHKCMTYIRTGQVPDADKFKPQKSGETSEIIIDVIKDKAKDELIDQAKEILKEAGPALAGYGGGEAALGGLAGPIGLAAGIAASVLIKLLQEKIKEDLTARYDVDERRRLYLATQGKSIYQKVVL